MLGIGVSDSRFHPFGDHEPCEVVAAVGNADPVGDDGESFRRQLVASCPDRCACWGGFFQLSGSVVEPAFDCGGH